MLALTPAVALTFTHLERFPSGVLFLALDQTSAAAVSAITRQLVAGFPSCVPYGGEFPDPHPHLTVALGTHPELDIIQSHAANALAPFLHAPFALTHATVMEQDRDRLWQQAHTIRLGTID